MRELDPATYGFTEADMDRQFFVGTLPGGPAVRTLREIIDHLRSVYCGFIGVQYMHVHDPDVKDWVQQKVGWKTLSLSLCFFFCLIPFLLSLFWKHVD